MIEIFARNTVDSLKYIRKLKEKNIGVYFEEEGINTLEMSGELLITILSAVAQQESETISSHVLLGLNWKSLTKDFLFSIFYDIVTINDN